MYPVATFLLLLGYFKSERGFCDAVDFSFKIPAFVMEERLPSVTRNCRSRICGESIVG